MYDKSGPVILVKHLEVWQQSTGCSLCKYSKEVWTVLWYIVWGPPFSKKKINTLIMLINSFNCVCHHQNQGRWHLRYLPSLTSCKSILTRVTVFNYWSFCLQHQAYKSICTTILDPHGHDGHGWMIIGENFMLPWQKVIKSYAFSAWLDLAGSAHAHRKNNMVITFQDGLIELLIVKNIPLWL